MSASDAFRDSFHTTINAFVDALSTHSEVHTFALILVTTLIVLVYFTEVSKFMMSGFDLESVVQSTLMVFVTLMLLGSFSVVFDTLYETLDNLGLLFLKIGTGNTDSFYLSKWVSKSLTYLYGEDSSIWNMAIGDLVYAGLWHITALLLQIAMYLIGSWAVWTLALAKILAILFIPFLAHPATRPLFDGWMKFTVGSLLLLVILRAVGVLVALGLKAQFHAIGVISCGGSTNFASCSFSARDGLAMAKNPSATSDTIVTMLIAVALVLASIGITTAIAGNIASPSKAIGRGMGKMAGNIMKSDALSKYIQKSMGDK
ncbi:type IV secretion system protein [Vibrio harveyi]|uniref:type IV secretion system protein n=1 Tax=Vibrio harveyi TaxID=669 RepID=UPI001EFDEC9C|nr:type IV secretion system protein [Vibrio harveyi]MCG9612855.1 type IV secretion system protein [Vibrio harveyi]MCG9671332.1 type IV secretion system protein [Vibrio harveyi]